MVDILGTRRATMTLYCDPLAPLGHCVRIVLAEKDVVADVQYVDEASKPEDLNDLNPYDDVLTLIDRDLVLYEPQVMLEYLDERYPHPPLMPIDPVSRANNRQLRLRIVRDLYGLVPALGGDDAQAAQAARRVMRDNLTAVAPAFAQRPFFLSEEMSLADCCMAPLLWRLEHWNIRLPAQVRPLIRYAERLFARPAFRRSLSPAERELRPA